MLPHMQSPVVLDGLSVRYMKNGAGGCWWQAAKANGQAHFGWSNIGHHLLLEPDWVEIESIIRHPPGRPPANRGSASTDLSRLRETLVEPERHVWVTFEDNCMWWCTLRSGAVPNPSGEDSSTGHFWLNCDRPWSNESLQGRRLSIGDLPGPVTRTSGYRATLCTPRASAQILRIIGGQQDPDAIAASAARAAYVNACAATVRRLGPQDFELLVELVLSRSGWARTSTVGKTREGVDIEAENPAIDETAFVQVKSSGSQAVLDQYVAVFEGRRADYSRMIFAVHTPDGAIEAPPGLPVQIWTCERLAALVVRLGLGEWVESRIS